MLSEKCVVVFYVFYPAGVYVGTLNLIASFPGPSIPTLKAKGSKVTLWSSVGFGVDVLWVLNLVRNVPCVSKF